MGIELPAELAGVAAQAGVRWPQADEEAMRSTAQAWRQAGAQLTSLTKDADGSANGALSAVSGSAGTAAGQHWQTFVAPDTGHLTGAATGCTQAADRLDHAADQVGAAKVRIVAHLVDLAKNTDAANQSAAAGHPTALAGLSTAVHGTASSVAQVNHTLTNSIRLDNAQPQPGGTGQQGLPGSPGLLGHAGVTGHDGLLGAQGPLGRDGVVGSLTHPALTGQDSAPGQQNVLATAGVTGQHGLLGGQGPLAQPGVTGHDGLLGGQGPLGQAGVTGHDGLLSGQGSPAVTGQDGLLGGQGPLGQTGVTGQDGLLGGQGPLGHNGVSGHDGVLGPQGPIAQAGGHDGLLGPPGHDGPAGVTGPLPQLGHGGPGSGGLLGSPGPGAQGGGGGPGIDGGLTGPIPTGTPGGPAQPIGPVLGGHDPGHLRTPPMGLTVAQSAAPATAPPPAAFAGPAATPLAAVPPQGAPLSAAPISAAPTPSFGTPAPDFSAAPRPMAPPPAAAPVASAPPLASTQAPAGSTQPPAGRAGAQDVVGVVDGPRSAAVQPGRRAVAALPGVSVGPGRPSPRRDEVALFLVYLFPIGQLPKASARPARQLPPPAEDADFAAGLRFEPHDHPESHLIDTDTAILPPPAHHGFVLADPEVADLAEGHDPLGGQHERDWEHRFLVRPADEAHRAEHAWPPGELFPEGGRDTGEPVVLAPDTVIDRFGTPEGRVFGEDAAPFARRSLPPDHLVAGYRRYRVTRDLPVWRSVSAAWFGQPGGGVRYRAVYPAADLVALGYLIEITGTDDDGH